MSSKKQKSRGSLFLKTLLKSLAFFKCILYNCAGRSKNGRFSSHSTTILRRFEKEKIIKKWLSKKLKIFLEKCEKIVDKPFWVW